MSVTRRTKRLLVLIALAALGYAGFWYLEIGDQDVPMQADYRAPVANPPIEPDRPDLLEEPRIE